MATHFSVLAWEIPWTEEPGGLQSIRSQKVQYDLVIKKKLQQQQLCNPGTVKSFQKPQNPN